MTNRLQFPWLTTESIKRNFKGFWFRQNSKKDKKKCFWYITTLKLTFQKISLVLCFLKTFFGQSLDCSVCIFMRKESDARSQNLNEFGKKSPKIGRSSQNWTFWSMEIFSSRRWTTIPAPLVNYRLQDYQNGPVYDYFTSFNSNKNFKQWNCKKVWTKTIFSQFCSTFGLKRDGKMNIFGWYKIGKYLRIIKPFSKICSNFSPINHQQKINSRHFSAVVCQKCFWNHQK